MSVERLQLGFTVGGDRMRPDLLRELEALPIQALWVGGHVAAPNPVPEAMMQLAWLAARTERVAVGTAILLLPLYPPAVIAKQVADLDRWCGGRLTLGIGVGGEYPAEFEACQVPVRERGARTDEAIPLLRQLWSGEPIDHEGRFFPMRQVRIHPAPLQSGGPPIVVAGRQPVAMRRAAALGDGWMPYLYSPRRYVESVEQIRAHAAAAGRDLSGFRWQLFLFTSLHDDPDLARQRAAEFLGGTYRQDFGDMINRVAAAGDVAGVTKRLQEFVDAGVREFIFAPCARDEEFLPMVRRIVEEVVPALSLP